MATSKRPRPAATFAGQAVALASGAWTELGLSGWTSTHGDWAIDPEPLVLFTAWLGDADPRLRDEATDWCIRNWRHISKTRLKNLLRQQPDNVRGAFGEFSATVGAHAGVTWPAATAPRRYTVTGRSTVPSLDRPSMAWLRLRAMFGIGARAEILRCFLANERELLSVAALAATTGYTKRNIAEECETLERAGLLSVRTSGNRFYYSVARPTALAAFVGDVAPIRPNWSAMLNVARELMTLETQVDVGTPKTIGVHVRKALRLLEDDLDDLGLERLPDVIGEDLWPAIRHFGIVHLGAWSIGQWPVQGASRLEAASGRRR